MAQVLLLLIATSLVPICISLIRSSPPSIKFWRAIGVVALNACIQAFFVVLVARNVLTLDYSLRFAIFGIPACILAIVLAIRDNGPWRTGATISPSIGLMIWAFLITLH